MYIWLEQDCSPTPSSSPPLSSSSGHRRSPLLIRSCSSPFPTKRADSSTFVSEEETVSDESSQASFSLHPQPKQPLGYSSTRMLHIWSLICIILTHLTLPKFWTLFNLVYSKTSHVREASSIETTVTDLESSSITLVKQSVTPYPNNSMASTTVKKQIYFINLFIGKRPHSLTL